MKFRYKKYSSRYNSVLRPVIPITLRNKDQRIGYEVLVDSGADLCLFDAEIGEALGINVKKGVAQEVMGVGGKVSFFYLHKVAIEIGGWPYEIEAGFMPRVGHFSAPYGLVGQKGFFDLFTVKSDLLKEEVELKERK